MIELDGIPELADPVMVAAFEGWNDAGEAASNAVKHLAEAYAGGGRVFAALDGEDYYDYQVHRPVLAAVDDVRQVIWPTTRFSIVRAPTRLLPGDAHEEPRDLVLVHGVEPNMRWRSFCEEILGLARDLGVGQIVTLGAYLADVPHSRPTPVTGTSADEAYQALFDVEPPTYEGPVGITGVFQEACRYAGIPLMSFWAAVPHYVAHPPVPKATLALLRRLEDVLDLSVPTKRLAEEAQAWEAGVDELAENDAEVGEYVRTLEEQRDNEDAADLPEASGEAIAREFERYLRRQERRRGPDEG
ncbi:filament polymerization regulator ParJ [Catenulispora subtropica]|uniref:Filament polymerization regulator ParJ n=1 Tax=Catenulispora subtropica TaxID=450798 RepID=A0ABP5E9Y3_9ACTN